jgi:hypothetical protein
MRSISPVVELAAIAPTADGLKTLYRKGKDTEKDARLGGTVVTMHLGFEDAIFLEVHAK